MRRIASGHCGTNACSSPGYTFRRASTPTSSRAAALRRDQTIGHESSLLPWWIRIGSVIRSKYVRGLISRQKRRA